MTRRDTARWALCLVLLAPTFASPLSATARLAVGYGVQMNAMLNHLVAENIGKQVRNSGSTTLFGQSAGTDYRSNWNATPTDVNMPYLLAQLPELRVSSDWQSGASTWGIFTALSGIVPQTIANYSGNYQLFENRTCTGIDYANCPLAALNFVTASGTGNYAMELRSSLRFYSFTAGLTWQRPLIPSIWGGTLSLVAESGLNLQSFSVYTQFVAARCSTGDLPPCAQIAQVRVVQGELNTQALWALGPYLGTTLRYERPQSRYFAEIGFSVVILFARTTNAGYTHFVAADTVAFSQSADNLGIRSAQIFFAALPSLSLRVGVRL